MRSMTGFGRGEASQNGHYFTVEVKTVNHRYLDISVRLPYSLGALEICARNRIKERLARGKTDVLVTYQNRSTDQGEVWINEERLSQYVSRLREMGIRYGLSDDLTLSCAASLPDVLTADQSALDTDVLEPIFLEALDKALDTVVTMREKEGQTLQKDFLSKIEELEQIVAQIEVKAPQVPQQYAQRLRQRVDELLSEVPSGNTADSSRLETEIAMYADHCAIDEELTRLHSHCTQFRQMCESRDPVGRQMDFLVQELNRETNTIASKSNDLEITQKTLQMKNLIEKIREQVQNIE